MFACLRDRAAQAAEEAVVAGVEGAAAVFVAMAVVMGVVVLVI